VRLSCFDVLPNPFGEGVVEGYPMMFWFIRQQFGSLKKKGVQGIVLQFFSLTH